MIQKDLKIGMAVGLILVIIAVIRLATDTRLSPEARLLRNTTAAQQQVDDYPEQNPDYRFIAGFEGEIEQGGASEDPSVRYSVNLPLQTVATEQPSVRNVPEYEPPQESELQRFHIVQSGQNLSAISKIYYGTASQWGKIFEANQGVLQDPDKLKPGTSLIIPD